MGFTTIDYFVLFTYLVGVTLLGLWFGRKQRDARDYFLGNRNIPWPAVCMSIVATETSTLTFIGIPALAYDTNLTFMQITFGYFIARIIISLLFIPAYYRGEMFTAYAFLERRFGDKTRNYASIIFLITRVLADGVRLFATAIPLSIVTGLSYPVSIAIISGVTLIYTFLGGIRAVVWMDVIQLIIYLGGALAAIWAILYKIPHGWEQIAHLANDAHKFKMFDFNLNLTTTYTIFSGFIGGCFLTMASHGTDQLMVQRLLTCKTADDSKKALIGSGFLIVGQFFLFLMIGVMLYGFYRIHPDQLNISRSDEIFPYFIVHELPAGLSGLVIAAIFAAAMSTLSSSLNSLASSTMMDLYKPHLKKMLSKSKELITSRFFTLFWAIILLLVAGLAGNWGNVLEAGLKIASFTYGGLLGVFLLGLALKNVNQMGAIVGMTVGLLTMLGVTTTAVAWPWYVMIGTVATFLSGWIISLFTSG
ncbi:MAG: sodium:solute symporter [Calditrichaeota bacterium]|nr:MAG: sodium:solute symporter [Calditrichota bacterium]